MNRLWWLQIRAVIRLELRKTFFARRGLWIYLLALAPVALFLTHSLVEIERHGFRQSMATHMAHPVSSQTFAAIHEGTTRDEVIAKLGEPPQVRMRSKRVRTADRQSERVELETLTYSDGDSEFMVFLENGQVSGTAISLGVGFAQDTYVFAGVFHFFFIRLSE